jgi:hypothetical protein
VANERRRLDDLKLRRATEGLDSESAAELARLLARSPDGDDRGYERAAAAVCLAVLGHGGSLPRRVRARIDANMSRLKR